MIPRTAKRVALIATLCAAPAIAQPWTPHSAAALLDASFPTEAACQHALDDARRHEHAHPSDPVHGLSYKALFDQGRCRTFQHKGVSAWRIRMHWKRRD